MRIALSKTTSYTPPHDYDDLATRLRGIAESISEIEMEIVSFTSDKGHAYSRNEVVDKLYDAYKNITDAAFHAWFIGQDMEEPSFAQ